MAKYSDTFMDWLMESDYTHCFYVAGGNVMHLLESASTRFKCIPFVHEVGACIAADYFNEVSEKASKAFVLVTAGPGTTNTVTGVAGAWTESRELLVIGGQAKSSEISKGRYRQIGFQEIDGVSLMRSITKASVRIDKQIGRMDLFSLIELSRSGRKGPVFLEMCLDVSTQETSSSLSVSINKVVESEISSNELDVLNVLNMLKQSERPLILVGGGVNRITDLTRLMECQIPIATTFNGSDRINSDYEFYCGRPNWYGSRWSNLVLQQSDLIIALGTRLGLQQTGYNWKSFAPLAKIVQVEIDNSELERGFPKLELAINSDANQFVNNLQEILSIDYKNLYLDWKKYIQSIKVGLMGPEKINTSEAPYLEAMKFVDDLINFSGGNEIIIPCSSGAAAYEGAMRVINLKGSQKMVTSHAMASMGYGLSGAIGAAFANPNKKVISFEGDGGFAQNQQELGVAVINDLNLKFFLLDNQGYQSIKGNQKNSFGGHYVGCDYSTGLALPNWVDFAKSYGAKLFEVDQETAFNHEFSKLFNSLGFVIFIVKIDPNQTYWPRIMSSRDEFGNVISNPLHLMDPPLDEDLSEKYLKYLN
jgi:acetolactate synthase I/II/III large subunit